MASLPSDPLAAKVRESYPKVHARTWSTAPRLSSSAAASSIACSPPPLPAAAVVGFPGAAYCPMAQGDPDQQEDFKELMAVALARRSIPCHAGCTYVDCRAHPGFLSNLVRIGRAPSTIVRTHSARRPSPTPLAVWDERPPVIIAKYARDKADTEAPEAKPGPR
jgi:hypothetical protein